MIYNLIDFYKFQHKHQRIKNIKMVKMDLKHKIQKLKMKIPIKLRLKNKTHKIKLKYLHNKNFK